MTKNQLSFAMPILLQPTPMNKVEIQIIADNLYLIGSFKNSKYSIFRINLENINIMGSENDLEEELAAIHSAAELFSNNFGSDKMLQVEGKYIPVHKEILVNFYNY